MINKKSILKAWENFEVISSNDGLSAKDQFETFKIYKEYLSNLPLTELIQKGWIESPDDTPSLVSFFQELHLRKSKPLFRKKTNTNEAIISFWLSQIRSDAQQNMASNAIPKFEGLTPTDLSSFAKLSANIANVNLISNFLAERGVILIFVRAIASMKLDGAVFKIAHVVLHMEYLDTPIIDDLEHDSESDIEASADRLALSSFISPSQWRNCPPKYEQSEESIIKFANEIGIHPCIVAGRLSRESNNYAKYSTLLNEFNVREMIYGES